MNFRQKLAHFIACCYRYKVMNLNSYITSLALSCCHLFIYILIRRSLSIQAHDLEIFFGILGHGNRFHSSLQLIEFDYINSVLICHVCYIGWHLRGAFDYDVVLCLLYCMLIKIWCIMSILNNQSLHYIYLWPHNKNPLH